MKTLLIVAAVIVAAAVVATAILIAVWLVVRPLLDETDECEPYNPNNYAKKVRHRHPSED